VTHDNAVFDGCRRLVEEGYLLALDDYVWSEHDSPILELAHIVKLDVLALNDADLEQHVERCRKFGVRLLAEKVETREQLRSCRQLGFELFQGYLLSRPSTERRKALSPSHLTCLRLIEKLCDPDVSAHELAALVETDASLSYRFLLGAPIAAAGGIHRPLNSVREGVILLGTRRLRDWIALMLLADAHGGSSERLSIAMTRARMAELLAETTVAAMRDAAFTVGLVSALDLLLDVPLESVVQNLSISQMLVDALLDHAGPLGDILSKVLLWELGGVGCKAETEEGLRNLELRYLEALAWSNGICSVIDRAS